MWGATVVGLGRDVNSQLSQGNLSRQSVPYQIAPLCEFTSDADLWECNEKFLWVNSLGDPGFHCWGLVSIPGQDELRSCKCRIDKKQFPLAVYPYWVFKLFLFNSFTYM